MRGIAALVVTLVASNADANPPEQPAEPSERTKWIAAGSVGAVHVAYATWSYFAWYRGAETKPFRTTSERYFDQSGYAGGADKIGHFWANYALTRGTTALLVAAGWKRLPSSLVASGLTELSFTLTELQDGYVYAFAYDDMIANVAGAAAAVLLENVPAVDRLLDFRVEYFPSRDYRDTFRKTGSIDIAQDYSGQSYLVALHLGALPGLRNEQWGYWSRFVDLAVGFEAKHYLPEPELRDTMPTQTLYFGLAFNMQGILTEVFDDSTGRRIANGAFEVFSVPYTTLRYGELSRQATMWPPQ